MVKKQILDFKIGEVKRGTAESESKPLLEIVIFLSNERTKDFRKLVELKTAALHDANDHSQLSARTTIVTLPNTDTQQDHEAIYSQFRKFILETLHKKPDRWKWTSNPPRKFCIEADETTSYLVKDFMAHHNPMFYRKTVGLVFLRTQKENGQFIFRQASRRFSNMERLLETERSFNDLLKDDSLLNPVTWIVTVNDRIDDTENWLNAAFMVVKLAYKQAVQDYSMPSLDLARKPPSKLPEEWRDYINTVVSRVSAGEYVQNYAENYKERRESEMFSGLKIETKGLPNERTRGLPTELTRGYGHTPFNKENGMRQHAAQLKLKQYVLCDPPKEIHSLAAVRLAQLGPMLRDMEARQQNPKQPWSLDSIEDRIPNSSVKFLLGHWESAKEDLLHRLVQLKITERIDDSYQVEAKDDVIYWSSRAMICLGSFAEATDRLEKVTSSQRLDDISVGDSNAHRAELIRLVHLLQLRGLSDAGMGEGFDVVDSSIDRAQALLRRLSPQEPSNTKTFLRAPVDYQVACISLNFTRARILTLRGNYRQALSKMLATTANSIFLFGESHIWTLEAAIYTSHLMVLTSKLRQGRILAERSLAAISLHCGKHHPLALEACGVLTLVADKEGRLLQASQYASEMAQSIQGSQELGLRPPLLLSCEIQQASIDLNSGNFKSAEDVLSKIVRNNGDVKDFIALRARSCLGLTQYHLGRLETSRSTILSAVRDQLQSLHGLSSDLLWANEKEASKRLNDLVRTGGLYFDHPDTKAKDSMLVSERLIHPEILGSLLTLSKIETSRRPFDATRVIELLSLIYHSSSVQLGDMNNMTMDAAMSLAKAKLLHADEKIPSHEANEHFLAAQRYLSFITSQASSVVNVRKPEMPQNKASVPNKKESNWLDISLACDGMKTDESITKIGMSHPMILKAHQELVIATFHRVNGAGMKANALHGMRQNLHQVLHAQEGTLGWDHPDRLQTQMAILTIQLACKDFDNAQRTLKDLLDRLRKGKVRYQRLAACLVMEQSILDMLSTHGNKFEVSIQDLARSIYQDVVEEMHTEKDKGLLAYYETLVVHVQDRR